MTLFTLIVLAINCLIDIKYRNVRISKYICNVFNYNFVVVQNKLNIFHDSFDTDKVCRCV